MNARRRHFIAGVAAAAGAAALDGFGIFRSSAQARSAMEMIFDNPSRDIEDYPHIIDVIPSKDMKAYFPLIVDTCTDPDADYLSKVPFLIELEVAKIWSESRFEWAVVSDAGAVGLQQLMETTARGYGLTVAKSPESERLNLSISRYRKLRSSTAAKSQELCAAASSGTGNLTKKNMGSINSMRSELAELRAKRKTAYRNMNAAQKAYVNKFIGMSIEQRKETDARFVPELIIPAGVKHLVGNILACKEYFGGSVEMNVWRGIAAYNAGLQRVKRWGGLPFIEETVHFTREIVSNLTRSLEMKYAYSTNNPAVIAETSARIRLK